MASIIKEALGMYGYAYVYTVAGARPQGPRELRRAAFANDKSIAEKHADIVGQFQKIANTKVQLGLSSDSITRLESAFFGTYQKATSGYWGGGLWDGFYRYASNPARHGLYFLVGEQLNDRNLDSLTPSARRFSVILGHLAQALHKEEEMLLKCAEMTGRSVALRNTTFEDIDAQRADFGRIGAECADVVAEIERCLGGVRETIGIASKEVWPEKKHYGKRLAISAVLYTLAGGIAVAGLVASSGILAIVGVALTMVIRLVGLGSIRGFDRERGWKSIESLLTSTKQLIETEGATMKTYLDIGDRHAALAREDMVWGVLKDIRTNVSRLNGRVDVMADQITSVTSGLDSLGGEVRQLRGGLESLQGEVQQIHATQEEMKASFHGVENKLDEFRSDLQRMSHIQQVSSARLAIAMLAPAAPEPRRSERPAHARANSWSPPMNGGARMA